MRRALVFKLEGYKMCVCAAMMTGTNPSTVLMKTFPVFGACAEFMSSWDGMATGSSDSARERNGVCTYAGAYSIRWLNACVGLYSRVRPRKAQVIAIGHTSVPLFVLSFFLSSYLSIYLSRG